MDSARGLWEDIADLRALLQSQMHNPLLEQWQLALGRRLARRSRWQTLRTLLYCFLPGLVLFNLVIRIGASRPSLDFLSYLLVMAPGPVCLLLAFQLRGLRSPYRALLLGMGGAACIFGSLFNLRLYNSDVEGIITCCVFLLGMPLLIYCLLAIHAAVLHGLQLSGEATDRALYSSADDIRLSLLDDREILLAFLALHLPGIWRRLAWLCLSAVLILPLLAPDTYNGNFVLLPALLGALAAWLNFCVAALLILLLALQSGSAAGSGSGATMLAGLLLAGQLAAALCSPFAYYGRQFTGGVYEWEKGAVYYWSGLWPLLLALPVEFLLVRQHSFAARSLRRVNQAAMLLLLLLVLLPEIATYLPEDQQSEVLPLAGALVLLLAYAGAVLLGRGRAGLRRVLLFAPAAFSVLGLLGAMLLVFGNQFSEPPLLLAELSRLSTLLNIGNMFAVQWPVFWGDYAHWNLPMFEWWRWPLHLALQFLLLLALYTAARERLAAWRQLED